MADRTIVIKFGSGILTREDGTALDDMQFEALVGAVAGLHRGGLRPVVVSSGAAAAGMMAFGIRQRPEDLATLQACCAVGQTRLMHFYETLFRQFGINVAQLLLTNDDFSTPGRRRNVENTLERLLSFDDVVPIINENDSVAVEELKVGDNDTLSARLAALARAEMLILLTGVDGLMDADGNLIREIADLESASSHVRPETGAWSVGGMASKLEAASEAIRAGIPAVIANGRKPEQLPELVAGGGHCTRILIPDSP